MKKFLKTKKGKVLTLIALISIFAVSSFLGYQTLTDSNNVQVTEETVSSEAVEVLKTRKDMNTDERIQLANDVSELDENGFADYEAMNRPTIEEIEEAQAHVDDLNSIYVGTVEIPSINLNINILEGTTYERMLYAATTIFPNSVMGKGNYALASHNMGQEGLMFTSLHKVKEGDDIYLKNNESWKTFHYQTTSVEIVNYKDTSCLEDQDEAVVTLITCENIYDTTNRVVVQGSLVD